MFGYVRTDTPYLYIKDQTLYEAMYCGVCKGIGAACGQLARLGLSYDIAFLSVLLHNIAGQDIEVKKQHCITHCIRSKQMAEVDELTRQLGALNTELVYYKCVDDIADGDRGGAKRLFFLGAHKRAAKKYPAIAAIVKEHMLLQQELERAKVDSVDRAADITAQMIAKLSDELLGEKRSEDTYALCYHIGKWIYLIDALDDYDKDRKKGAYNPFICAYGAASREELLKTQGDEVGFIFRSVFCEISDRLRKIPMKFNRDLIDNVLLRGLPQETKRVMEQDACKKCKKRK
ncbi:MAG: hypothetical protein IJX98_01930 [Clostridia bacterium]|nr:hypothetical protein [Clostridia bacterium]